MLLLKNAQENAMSSHFSNFPLFLADLALPLVFSPFDQDKVTVAFLFLLFSTFLWDGWSLIPAPARTCIPSRRSYPGEAVPAQAPARADRPSPATLRSAGQSRQPGEKLLPKTQRVSSLCCLFAFGSYTIT